MVVPKFWSYVNVPEQQNGATILEQLINDPSLRLSFRKFCDETHADPDIPYDTAEDLLHRLRSGQCHGRNFNHLLWDVKVFSSLAQKPSEASRFLISDGGLTRFTKGSGSESEPSWLAIDPYNSSLYKMAVLSQHPVVYIEKHADRQVIPIYIHSSQSEDEDEKKVVSDDESTATASTSTSTTPLPPKFVMKSQPPSLYLAQAVRVQDDSLISTVAVTGLQLEASFLTSLLSNATSEDQGPSCTSSDISCYLMDTSGYVLASNTEDVRAGDFMGVADPQVMEHFLEKNFFRSRLEYNYQALCPTEINCQTDGVADLPRLFVLNLGQAAVTLLQQLSYGLYALFFSLFMGRVDSVSEYTKQVSEGLHRCTTRTQHWEWADLPSSDIHHDRIDVTCKGIHCVRQLHSYKLKRLNAILVVAETPEWCIQCRPTLIFDGPLEGNF